MALLATACSTEPAPAPATGTEPVPLAAETAPLESPLAAAPSTAAAATLAPTELVAAEAPPAPGCSAPAPATPAQTEGPYFTPGSPERASLLEPGMTGTKLVVTGRVLSTDCQPLPGVTLDFWQADDQGAYDNVGYRLRGHQLTDEAGRYRLETIVPARYPGRPPHIHVKVGAPGQPILTTQLYFPDEPSNQADQIFNPALVMAMQDGPDAQHGSFDFVLDLEP
jgi:protocatechuate 3,4-dioxygenase beta subunit